MKRTLELCQSVTPRTSQVCTDFVGSYKRSSVPVDCKCFHTVSTTVLPLFYDSLNMICKGLLEAAQLGYCSLKKGRGLGPALAPHSKS